MSTSTTTETYTTTDIQHVVRRFGADIRMIAESSGAITTAEAERYIHDVELLAKKGYLATVDVTLLNLGAEVRAVRYTVDTDAGGLTTSRPGNAMWPRVNYPTLRVILSYTGAYDAAARETTRDRLSFTWTPSQDDTSHSGLQAGGGRDYVSGSYGMRRKDWGQ